MEEIRCLAYVNILMNPYTSQLQSVRVRLTINLDLRRAHAGQYYISTTHEQDQASYYYPVQIG
jgi:hypothetical protein